MTIRLAKSALTSAELLARLAGQNVAAASLVVGTDPGGSELLRVGGHIRASGTIIAGSSPNPFYAYDNGAGFELGRYGQGAAIKVDTNLKVIVGTDPGGTELLRVGGGIRVNASVIANIAGSNGIIYDVASGADRYGLGFFSPGGRATVGVTCNSAYGSASVSLGAWDGATYTEYLRTGPASSGAVIIGTDPGGSELLRVGGGISIPDGNRLAGVWSGPDVRNLVSATTFGYSSSYKATKIGTSTGNYLTAVTVALGVDPNSVTGGSFSGNGSEILLGRNTVLLQPNSGTTDWERASLSLGSLIIGTDPGGSELLRVGGAVACAGLTTTAAVGVEHVGTVGAPAYLRISQTANGGKIWRFGNTGAVDYSTFDIYNQSDGVTAITISPTGDTGLRYTPVAGNGALQLANHTTKAGGIALGTSAFIYREAAYQATIAQTADANGAIIGFKDETNSAFRGLIGYGAYLFTSGSISDFGITSYAALKLGTNGGTTAITIDTSQNTDLAGNCNVASGKVYKVNGTQVIGAQGAAVADASAVSGTATSGGYGFVDATEFGNFVTAVNALKDQLNAALARLRAHGLIAT